MRYALSALFIGLVLAYVMMPEPFSFILIIPPKLRIACEFLLLISFTLLFFITHAAREMRLSLALLLAASFWLLVSNPQMTTTDGNSAPSLVAKIAMLLTGSQVLARCPQLLRLMTLAWVVLWSAISIQTILSCLAFNFHLIEFAPVAVAGWLPQVKSADSVHPVLGFVNSWNLFGYFFGKPMGFLLEPIALGFCLGLNVLMKPGYARYFGPLNLLAGLCTGSMAFILFFVLLAVYKILDTVFQGKNRLLTGVIVGGVAILFLALTIQCTSLNDRALRLAIGMEALLQSNLWSLLFGNLHYAATTTIPGSESKTISSGFLTVLVQRGIPMFLFLCYLLHRFARGNGLLLAYLLFYGLLLQYFWWPVFIIFLMMVSAGAEVRQKPVE